MASIGTIIIAWFGYGFSLLSGLGAGAALFDAARARKDGDDAKAKEERETFVGCVVVTIISAAVTRWLVGGA